MASSSSSSSSSAAASMAAAASSYPPFSAGGEPSKKKSKILVQYEETTTTAEKKAKNTSEMKITELLEYNVGEKLLQDRNNKNSSTDTDACVKKQIAPTHRRPNMEGDILSKAIRYEYFMGVKIGWPYPEMLKPQRLMCLHIIKALQSRKHVVLESPTGTGKSAAILCSTLAWQRYHQQTTTSKEKVRIIYCSRTHAQVKQMVSSLQNTPYRPSMTVLGSRDRMCIHSGANNKTKNVNNECRTRVKATEKTRKSKLKSLQAKYDDDHPPIYWDTDDLLETSTTTTTANTDDSSSKKPTCSHYRQLGTTRTAAAMLSRFRPSNNNIGTSTTMTTIGDDDNDASSSKYGTHDIEDLIQFGKNPSSYYNNVADGTTMKDDEDVSPHSACPYYISRALEKHAELVFCPYNYILDPMIRKKLEINLNNTIVILDEAHNVEDTLRTGGSGTWGEIELCSMISALLYYAGADSRYVGGNDAADIMNNKDKVPLNEMAHEIAVFLEKMVLFMLDGKRKFEKNGGAVKAIDEWRRFHTPDNKQFELSYDGPNGYGRGGESVGCRPFFEKLAISPTQATLLRRYAEEINDNIHRRDDIQSILNQNLFDQMVDAVTKLTLAMEQPQHYFIQTTVQANGSFHFASVGATSGSRNNRVSSSERRSSSWQQQQKQPKSLPYSHCRSASSANNALVDRCLFCKDEACGHELIYVQNAIRHGSYNNGSKPAWESFLVLELLTPSLFMQDLTKNCRSVILASGSLAPLPSLCGELGLRASSSEKVVPAAAPSPALKAANVPDSSTAEPPGRLQVRPPPLEADHVINLQKQLLAVAIGQFPNGDRLTVNYNQYKHDAFVEKLGDGIAAVIESIPRGGVLVFLSSYSLLRRCIKAWNPESSYERFAAFDRDQSISPWSRFLSSKGKVIVEPTGSQADFEAARDEYAEAIRSSGSCILFAVFRGKMSEGISFNDDNARGVICVGIPFPSSYERSIQAKKSYNDEQRRIGKRTDLLPGNSWYSQQAYRAIAQALGRCIRHAGDYGTIILMDSRHCDESPPDHNGMCIAHRDLPKWMRSHVKTVVSRSIHDTNGKTIGGGWPGLKASMQSFFQEAPVYAAEVLRKQSQNLCAAQERASATPVAKFNRESGQWSTTTKDSKNAIPAGVLASASDNINDTKLPPIGDVVAMTPLRAESTEKASQDFAQSVSRDTPETAAADQASSGNGAGHASNAELIAAFDELSDLYSKSGNANAGATYRRVVASLRGIDFAVTAENAKGLCKGKSKVAGIGKASADKMHEFIATGKIAKLEEKRAETASTSRCV